MSGHVPRNFLLLFHVLRSMRVLRRLLWVISTCTIRLIRSLTYYR